MSTVATQPDVLDPQTAEVLAELESIPLISSDGVPMESGWHVKNMTLLIDQIDHHFADRDDFYVGGNMFIYFSEEQARNRDFRGPDFFYVSKTKRYPLRKWWALWKENNRTPDVVIELASESTQDEDRGPKFRIYRDTLWVGNYFIYDPVTRKLDGWRLDRKKYVPIRAGTDGRLVSDELDLALGVWEGKYQGYVDHWLRFFDRSGTVLPTFEEGAEIEKQRADAEKTRADAAEQAATSERQRADALAAEVAHLKEQLARATPEAKP
jgi:Uma2 family endonuclease